MKFINSLEFGADQGKRKLWEKIGELFSNRDGIAYHKHPVFKENEKRMDPEFIILDRQFGIILINNIEQADDEIKSIGPDGTIKSLSNPKGFNPFEKLEEEVIGLENILRGNRVLRQKLKEHKISVDNIPVTGFLIAPYLNSEKREKMSSIGQGAFLEKTINDIELQDFSTNSSDKIFKESAVWDAVIVAFQGLGFSAPVSNYVDDSIDKKTRAGILKSIQQQMNTLDYNQEKFALQIANGLQEIKGLAGSGKSIILAMKAAHYHRQYPDHRVVITYTTKTLKDYLITNVRRFYKYWSKEEPNWEKLQVMHSWGGSSEPGVYSEICESNSIPRLSLEEARQNTFYDPFGYICGEALKHSINPIFDLILLDEAQDFPISFLQLCKRALRDPKRLVVAMDETQVLTTLEPPILKTAFADDSGWLNQSYEDGIEKDCILKVCYRNTRQVLTFAYAMALGIYNKEGFAQILEKKSEWESIGFEFVAGEKLKRGEKVIIQRPMVYSPLRFPTDDQIFVKNFNSTEDEIKWLVSEIKRNISVEGILPHDILVVSLAPYKKLATILTTIQDKLAEVSISAKIPGVTHSSSTFFTENQVTLTNVRRAKGNESAIVFVCNLENLSNNPSNIPLRNSLFTSITRTKGWCYLSGNMPANDKVLAEINTTLTHIKNDCKLEFNWPDVALIHKKITTYKQERRKRNETAVNQSAQEIVKAALTDPSLLDTLDPGLKAQLARLLNKS
ncbi:MAG: ATP-binding domain-containing protein [Desulfitobacterium hafniense]|nr:ATP-binding domain-containing protein [Desulfitobacterium hafniense]